MVKPANKGRTRAAGVGGKPECSKPNMAAGVLIKKLLMHCRLKPKHKSTNNALYRLSPPHLIDTKCVSPGCILYWVSSMTSVHFPCVPLTHWQAPSLAAMGLSPLGAQKGVAKGPPQNCESFGSPIIPDDSHRELRAVIVPPRNILRMQRLSPAIRPLHRFRMIDRASTWFEPMSPCPKSKPYREHRNPIVSISEPKPQKLWIWRTA